MVAIVDDEFKKFARALRGVQLGFEDMLIELEKKISQLEGEKNQMEENLTREREAFRSELEKEREAAALKLKEVRAKSVAEGERLVTASATSRNILEIESSGLRVVDLEGLLEVEKKSSAELQKELDVARERKKQTLLYNAEYADEYEALSSQYEDRLDDNVKLFLKNEEAKRQVEDKTATILSKDLALNQLNNELVELKEKASALNEEISDMKFNIRALNEQLLKREIDLDTAPTNLVVSEADLEKLSSIIMGKDQELHNSEQIRNSLIARLGRLKVDLRRLKGREAQSKADLAEVLANNQSLVDEWPKLAKA
ncbi:hypothetical protein GIB67_012772 [Kingdonia uniflora]|uniref:Uncharacterized protein n=1 Tax=Kingdonia uniflora TaxID=39325 RepID=A0A7J7NFA9_9MAGN|nr:hypothetical protein GIB67_012772 [Kingdonia uniflora]